MKKIKLLFGLLIFSLFLGTSNVSAASGNVYVYYGGSSRYPTYTYTNTHLSSIGYNVSALNNAGSGSLLSSLQEIKVAVYHYHGNTGRQYTGEINNTLNGIAAQNGNGTTIKNISSLSSNSLSQLKMAIYYGCSTGVSTSTYGNLPSKTVAKGAQAAVAWKVTTYVSEVNEWNRLFFEKAKGDTIVEGYRHADYWLAYTNDSTAQARMRDNRNEAGNIYGYVY